MTDLAYLDLTNLDGALLQKRGTISVEQLMADERAHAPGSSNRIRLLTASDQQSTHSMRRVHQALAATLKALARPMWLQDLGAEVPQFVCWRDQGHLRPLTGIDAAESIDVWLRNAGPSEVLVQLGDLKLDDILDASRIIEQYYGDLLSQVISEEERYRGYAPADMSVEAHLVPIEVAAAAKRAALASDWPTAAQVSRAMGSTAGNASHLATKLRRDGQLLAVYLPSPTPSYRFPRWQFRPDGQPVEKFADILTILRKQGPFLDENRRTTGWGEVEWFNSAHVLLDGATPAEMLSSDPNRVLTAAETEFGSDA